MKKSYMIPEFEIVEFALRDVILSSPTEGDIPIEGNTEPVLPGDELDI